MLAENNIQRHSFTEQIVIIFIGLKYIRKEGKVAQQVKPCYQAYGGKTECPSSGLQIYTMENISTPKKYFYFFNF